MDPVALKSARVASLDPFEQIEFEPRKFTAEEKDQEAYCLDRYTMIAIFKGNVLDRLEQDFKDKVFLGKYNQAVTIGFMLDMLRDKLDELCDLCHEEMGE